MPETTKKEISIIGLGVVGLTTAVGFALKGHSVTGIDIDAEKVSKISAGISPTYEQELAKALKTAKLNVTTEFREALSSDVSFICGGTPGKSDGFINLHYVKGPADQLAKTLREKKTPHLVVVRSTVVPGTTEKVIAPCFKDSLT